MVFDFFVALFWLFFSTLGFLLMANSGDERFRGLLWTALPWMLPGSLAIVLRRRWFKVAVALQVASYVLPLVVHDAWWGTSSFSLYILIYTACADHGWRTALISIGLLLGSGTLATYFFPADIMGQGSTTATYVTTYVLALTAVFSGRLVHNRRALVEALRTRAQVAEENQQALAAQAVSDERRRIARELHDVVAHHVSVMGVMATGARRVLANDPRRADEALSTIEDTGRTALREMRRLLDVLRTSDEDAAELTPQPGLSGVQSLVDQVREAGLPVRLLIEGPERELDPGVALSVYRIVQEALTNTLKHGGRAKAEVRIKFGEEELQVEVFDDGRGPRLTPPVPGERVGHGLVGMRERISLYGGTLRTGPRPGGGFRVYAKIPVDSPSDGSIS
ncbi:two-component sensor histidine kinase [Actinorhabdospora filicis]|uniref:histidine kinase n=2 Tax=Actinorhabdospora filicis TaxID=1785913 RepID=A0A9W6W9Y8_9ACTN|nr:two-component sensor histidine kinase [Actinorhabdospora filicis]